MTKEEYRKHCEEQIKRCIKLRDIKYLKEHELSLALLNECEDRKQRKDNLIKYLEDSIKELKEAQRILYENACTKLVEKATVNSTIRTYQDVLERLKNNDK